MLSPGTSAEVSDYDDDDEDDEDDDQDDEDNSLSKASFHSKTIPDPSNTSSAPQFVSNELTEKLERLCQQQQEEVDEKTEAEIFLAAYSANPAAATAAIVHKTQSNFEDGLRKRPFYNAQLAVPSAISTPDIYHPQQQHYFESPTNGDGMINSMSYNSMAYPSVTDSEVVTPSIEPAIDTGRTRLRSSSFNQDRSKLLPLFPINHYQNKRLSKTWIDPKVKPLPLLVVADEPPISKKKKDDKVEQWRMSVHQQESSPTKAKETQPSLKHSESNLTEVKTKKCSTH
jgi:hypothetical protein